jgi:hypothetical protein
MERGKIKTRLCYGNSAPLERDNPEDLFLIAP